LTNIRNGAIVFIFTVLVPLAAGTHEGGSGAEISVDERLGQFVPLELTFVDE
jgi:hypothetical protein